MLNVAVSGRVNCQLCRSTSASLDDRNTRVISASCVVDGDFKRSSPPAGVSIGGDVSSMARALSSFHIIGSSLWKSIIFFVSFVIHEQRHSVLKTKIIQHCRHSIKMFFNPSQTALNLRRLNYRKALQYSLLLMLLSPLLPVSLSSDTYFLRPTNWLTGGVGLTGAC